MNEFRVPQRKFEAAKKNLPKKPPTVGGRTDEEVRDFLIRIIDKSKKTRDPKVIKTDNPTAGKGGTGTKRPDGSGGQAEDH